MYGAYNSDEKCDDFSLRELENVLYTRISIITQSATSRSIYTPTAPDQIQKFSKLKCGFLYELVFKPGQTRNIKIPNFVQNKLGGSDAGRINKNFKGGIVTDKIIKLNEFNYTFVMGWYGGSVKMSVHHLI